MLRSKVAQQQVAQNQFGQYTGCGVPGVLVLFIPGGHALRTARKTIGDNAVASMQGLIEWPFLPTHRFYSYLERAVFSFKVRKRLSFQ